MPLLTPSETIQVMRSWDDSIPTSYAHAQGPAGETLLLTAMNVLGTWHSHSQYLAEDADDETQPHLTDAEFIGLLDEMTRGPRPPHVASTFSRDDLYADDMP